MNTAQGSSQIGFAFLILLAFGVGFKIQNGTYLGWLLAAIVVGFVGGMLALISAARLALNWSVGAISLGATGALFALREGHEERMQPIGLALVFVLVATIAVLFVGLRRRPLDSASAE